MSEDDAHFRDPPDEVGEPEGIRERIQRQRRVDDLLQRGLVFSLFWILGAGSALALYNARKADRLISDSNGQLHGKSLVWLCYTLGGIGVCLSLVIFTTILMNRFNR